MPFDFATVSAPFRMQPGLRRIAPGARQLTPNALGDRALREKLGVLRQHPAQALLAAPGFDAAPALNALLRQAATEHADAFAWDGALALDATRLRWSVRGSAVHGDGPAEIGACLRALPPEWRLPGLLSLALAEDFAVIDGATARIPWLAVCLPSRWAPEEKIGRHFAEVHAPVADNQVLLAAADHLARLVTGTDRWERFVWTINAEPRLMQHPQHVPPTAWPAALDAEGLAAVASFRTEHQTFIPLADAHQAVFTIGVDSQPLIEAVDSPERARRLHDALASMSDAVLAYRGLTDARDRLLAWLAATATAA
ncbi:MAG TPA: heme-dependent oxidative N-demethylase subunit alpha family protein [Burkholderiaceae bacterium]|nr:heme-dependent oxidative N-demethylase subunit alpha family protein [Burkholderiaceae bacterium]